MVNINIVSPNVSVSSFTLNELWAGIPDAINELLAKWKITGVKLTGFDDPISFYFANAEIWGSPNVETNVEADGTLNPMLTVDYDYSYGPFKLFGITLVPKVTGSLHMKGGWNFGFQSFKHDWGTEPGNMSHGWSGSFGGTTSFSISGGSGPEVPINIGSVKSIQPISGGSLAGILGTSIDTDTFTLTLSAGLSKVKLTVALQVNYTDGSSQTINIFPELGFLEQAITLPIQVSNSKWQSPQ